MPAETTTQLAATLAHTFTAEQLHQLHEDAVAEIDTVVDTDAWGILVDALFIARTPGDAHPAVEQIRQLRAKVAEQEALLTQAYDHNVDVQDDREQLTAQLTEAQDERARVGVTLADLRQQLDTATADRTRFKNELAAVRDAAYRQQQRLGGERAQWQAEIANLRNLTTGCKDTDVIPVASIIEALREGPPSPPDCPHLADILAGRAKGCHDDSTCGWCAVIRSGTAPVPGSSRHAPEPDRCSTDVDHGQVCGNCPIDPYGTHQCQRPVGHGFRNHVCRCGHTWTSPRAQDEPTDDEIAAEIDSAEEQAEVEEAGRELLDVLRSVPLPFEANRAAYRLRLALGGVPAGESQASEPAERLAATEPDADLFAQALAAAYTALNAAEKMCRYHGTDFERLGMWNGMPRCDSCKQPYRVNLALAAIEAAKDGPEVPAPKLAQGGIVERPIDLDDRTPRPPAQADVALLDQRAESWATAEEETER